MTYPPDWILLEAAKRAKWLYDSIEELQYQYDWDGTCAAFCDALNQLAEAGLLKEPVDPDLLLAREVVGDVLDKVSCTDAADKHRKGKHDLSDIIQACLEMARRVRKQQA